MKIDNTMKKIISLLQKGLPISSRPYEHIAGRVGLTESEVIRKIKILKRSGLLKRIDLGIDAHKLGFVNTLVACNIPEKEIKNAGKVIAGYGNITHNYLRNHRLNMWFTMSAASGKKMGQMLKKLKSELRTDELVSLPTEKVFKLRFNLNVV